MYAIEKKYEIEMKLKKEMTNIQELKAAANRSSSLASDVCNVLGACEQRLQQLETAVLPLYGDTARLQQIHYNMERTVKALDHVINYYMVARELDILIQAGPHTTSPEALNSYLEALDKLSEAQNYFNKNNPQSVELENINQLYNTGVSKLESAFEDLLSRNTRPLSPTTLMDMIALEEDSSVDSVSVSNSASSTSGTDCLRAAAAWLGAAGRAPHAALLAARAPAAKSSLMAFRDYLRTRTMGSSPLMRSKNILNRSDSTKKTSKIHKAIEKRANKIMMKASQTLEQSTGLGFGRKSIMNDSYTEESPSGGGTGSEDSNEAEWGGSLATALCRLARHEQRWLLGLVPLPRLPPLLAAVLAPPLALLAADCERACGRWRRLAAGCDAAAASCWALLARLQRLQPEYERGAAPAPPQPYLALVADCRTQCIKCLEDWTEGLKSDGSAAPVDGTVHQLAAAALAFLASLAEHTAVLGPALGAEAGYARAAAAAPAARDRNSLMLALYMRKVLAQLNLVLRSKSEQYSSDALKAIFLLNNINYLLQGLQSSGLIEVLMLAEPTCEASYRDMIQEHKNAYLQTWNKLISYTVLDEPISSKLRDKDKQMLKDKFSSFNRELEDCSRQQRGLSVPDGELRGALQRGAQARLLPPYSRLLRAAAAVAFARHVDKYIKYTPEQVAAQIDGYFDEAA